MQSASVVISGYGSYHLVCLDTVSRLLVLLDHVRSLLCNSVDGADDVAGDIVGKDGSISHAEILDALDA